MSSQLTEQWYVQSSQGELGPYSLTQLQQLAGRGAIHRGSLLRSARSSSWIRAEQMPSIFSNAPIRTNNPQLVNQEANKQSRPPALPKATTETGMPLKEIGQAQTILVASIVGGISFLIFALMLATSFTENLTQAERVTPRQPESSSTPQPIERESSSNVPSAVTDSLASGTTASTSTANNYLSTEELISRTKGSVAIVRTPVGSGSGFVVERGVVATNYHVIAGSDADNIEVFFEDGPPGKKGPFPARLIAEAPNRDLALLQVNSGAAPLTFDGHGWFGSRPGRAATKPYTPGSCARWSIAGRVRVAVARPGYHPTP